MEKPAWTERVMARFGALQARDGTVRTWTRLSEESGVRYARLVYLRQGGGKPQSSEAQAIARALDTYPAHLFSADEIVPDGHGRSAYSRRKPRPLRAAS